MDKELKKFLYDVFVSLIVSVFSGLGCFYFYNILFNISFKYSILMTICFSCLTQILLFIWIIEIAEYNKIKERLLEIKEKHKQRK